MKLSEFKHLLQNSKQLNFRLPTGKSVESHFHITELGQISKKFIDCGGTLRNEDVITLQLWSSNDFDHRLEPKKVLDIVDLSMEKLQLTDNEIEVSYQGDTIETYGLGFDGTDFILESKFTDCLAKDNCGIPEESAPEEIPELNDQNQCTPGSGCC